MNRLMTWRVFFCAMLALSLTTAAWADYGAGRSAWKAGRYAEALKEWRASARTGDKRAMVALGRAFVKGVGVPQDFVEAHKWLNLAAARGDAKAAAERDAIEKRMTIEEQAEARKLARAWRNADRRRGRSDTSAPGCARHATATAPDGAQGIPRERCFARGGCGEHLRPRGGAGGGADPNARGRRGWTPLMHAADKGYKLLVPPLLKAGAEPDIQAADGATALFIAALRGRSGIVELLMKAGADPGIKGPKGRTAEEAGYLGKNPRIIEALGLVKTIPESNDMVWKAPYWGARGMAAGRRPGPTARSWQKVRTSTAKSTAAGRKRIEIESS